MARITDATRDSGEPHFECGTKAVWEKHGDFESAAFHETGDAPGMDESAKRSEETAADESVEGDHRVDFGDGFPDIRELGRREDGHVRIGPATLDGAHCGDGHHGIAEPVG